MTDPFNRFTGHAFLRQQPAHLRDLPWSDAGTDWQAVKRIAGQIVFWLCVLALWFVCVALGFGHA